MQSSRQTGASAFYLPCGCRLEPSGNEAELAQGVFDGQVSNFWKNISIAGGSCFYWLQVQVNIALTQKN
jgi:hypothetical protein